jgi:hypothetical protein
MQVPEGFLALPLAQDLPRWTAAVQVARVDEQVKQRKALGRKDQAATNGETPVEENVDSEAPRSANDGLAGHVDGRAMAPARDPRGSGDSCDWPRARRTQGRVGLGLRPQRAALESWFRAMPVASGLACA